MKTSIVAVIAASLFLVAAYMGLGGHPGAPPGAPQMIAIAGPSSDAASPTIADLPLTLPSSPAPSQVLAVGRQVVPGSLKDLATRGTTSGGAVNTAAGPPAASGQFDPTVNTDVQSLPRSGPGATSPPVNVANPVPLPIPTPVVFPTRKPRPEPSPTPQPPAPKPTPTPSPTPTVTGTATPPVTSTASSSSPTPAPHP
jgi:hypothetical protein